MRLFLLLFCFSKLNAQTTQPTTVPKLKLPIDSVIIINGQKVDLKKSSGTYVLAYTISRLDTTIFRMPNALNGFKDEQQKVVNNGKGFDVYQSTVDNMAVLKPDAQNLASLTNGVMQQHFKIDNGKFIIPVMPLQKFKYYKPLSNNERKLLELLKSK